MSKNPLMRVCFFYLFVASAVSLFSGGLSVDAGTNQVTAVDLGGRIDYVATGTGDIYIGEHNTPDGADTRWTLAGHLSSSSQIVQIQHLFSDATHEYVWAYTADGTLFVSDDNGQTWNQRGNLFGSTPVFNSTWGHLKARYR